MRKITQSEHSKLRAHKC